MRFDYFRLAVFPLVSLAFTALAAPPFDGPALYGDPPDAHHPWAVHDRNRPQPRVVTPGTFSSQDQPGKPPSDAIVLFNGNSLTNWEADTGVNVPTKWIIHDGAMECVPGSGYIRTKAQFGDCQLHVEWAAPTPPQGESQGRGNSGVFLQGLVEIQVLDNYKNPTYADGMAGSVYGVNPPMVNALRPPGQFQVYDIVYRRPIFKNGEEIDPGWVTVFENGVLVQDHTRLEGPTGHMARAKPQAFPEVGPLKLQDHGNPVRYRNIWYRPLPPRPIEGGTDGYLTPEAVLAKRKEIAASVRQDADISRMLRLAESLEYESNDATLQEFEKWVAQYAEALKDLPADQLAPKKDEVKHIQNVLASLTRFKALPAEFEPKARLEQIIKDQNWNKK